jgi:hypothetical protein
MVVATSVLAAGPGIREVEVWFPTGKSGTTLKGEISGDETVDYKVRAAAGQRMEVTFRPTSTSAYFNVLPPGSETAIFIGSTSGNRFEGTLPTDGTYTIRVYLMRSAARRGANASYGLDVAVSGEARSPWRAPGAPPVGPG